MHAPPPSGGFPLTRWTLLDRVASGAPEDAHHALNELVTRYLPALRAYLERGRGLPQDRAADLLQGFIADKILMGDLLQRARRSRGRFRTLLLTSLERYVISDFRKEHTARRMPDNGLVSIDLLPAAQLPATAPFRPDLVYDMAWIREVISQTLRRVEHACQETGREGHWAIFQDRIVKPTLYHAPVAPYGTLAERLHFRSPVSAWNALETVKRMFDRTLREVIREYVGDDQAVEDELREIFVTLAKVEDAAP